MRNDTLSRAAPEVVKKYFKWLCLIPASDSPCFASDGRRIIEANKSDLKSDEYIFLPPGIPGPFNRDIGTVEHGKKLVIASLSFIGSDFESPGADITQLYKFADVDHDSIEYRRIEIDGEPLGGDLENDYRVHHFEPFDVEYPDGALFGVTKGVSKAVADGVYIVWEPSVGKHKIHFEGKINLAGRKDSIDHEPVEDHIENVTYTFEVI